MEVAELRVKHLEMVQAVISRMAAQSATLKNWCVTLTVALTGYALSQHRPGMLIPAAIAIVILGGLDAQYLRIERRFRGLFDKIRLETWGEAPTFEIDLRNVPQIAYVDALKSWSIYQFYGPLLGGVILALIVWSALNGPGNR